MRKRIKDGRPFKVKHPHWNTFISLIVVLIIVAIVLILAYLIITFVGKLFSMFISFLYNTVSKLDAVIIVALITGTVSLLGVIISSIVAKHIEYKKTRQMYLAQKREKAYAAFIQMVYRLLYKKNGQQEYSSDDMVSDMLSFSEELTLWGSKKVANKWSEFIQKGANPESALDNLFLLEGIMNEMRYDMGVKRVQKGNLLLLVKELKTSINK